MSMRLLIGSLVLTLLSGCHPHGEDSSSATAPHPPRLVPDPDPAPRAHRVPLRYTYSPNLSKEPLRVGGDVTEPVLVRQVQPTLPHSCPSSRFEGIFILKAVVSSSGQVIGLRTLRPGSVSPPCPEAEPALHSAVARWRYKPATFGGQPVSVYLTITIPFPPPSR